MSGEHLDVAAVRRIAGTVRLPGSKSISNRVLLLAALADGDTLVRDLLDADDTGYMLAALATHGGELSVSGAGELRVKESDRISALSDGLRRLGGDVEERPDGFLVRGRRRLAGGEADAKGDHRLAMAFAVAALGAAAPSTILDAGSAAVSYPEFFSVLESLRA